MLGNKNDLKYLRDIDYDNCIEKTDSLNGILKEINYVDENSVHDTIKYLVGKIFFNDLDDIEKEKVKEMLKE